MPGQSTTVPTDFLKPAKSTDKPRQIGPYTPIDFSEIQRTANFLAYAIENQLETLLEILLQYETYEVAKDEIERSLDLLHNLHKNEEYFKLRINEVTAFLPKNQPLYAFTCFVVVPALMAEAVHFRIPATMRFFFPELLEVLEIPKRFPNIKVSDKQRLEFLKERSAMRVDRRTNESLPVTDAVIFTGTSSHAEQLRQVFDDRTLFITNGSGHNPVVIGADADLNHAVEAVSALQFYNQGQDCAGPNSILIHEDIYSAFYERFLDEVKTIKVGDYNDRSNRVGPISNPGDLVRIQEILVKNQRWLDANAPGVVRANEAILEPTIINKPLREGGNFEEVFAPVVFLQVYENDRELNNYFESSHYAKNAMYVTLYGNSPYIERMIGKKFKTGVLHEPESFLHNKHLHERGVERGTKPYGGSGFGASNLSIDGKLIAKATLPQRDIYEHLVEPLLKLDQHIRKQEKLNRCSEIEEKNVEKILHLHSTARTEPEALPVSHDLYVDLRALSDANGHAFVKVSDEYTCTLLEHPNVKQIASMTESDIDSVRKLRKLLLGKRSADFEETFKMELYDIANGNNTAVRDRERQLHFFRQVYQLLLGKDSGPRLYQLLPAIEVDKIVKLLDV